jgi:hypothetical protein
MRAYVYVWLRCTGSLVTTLSMDMMARSRGGGALFSVADAI